jgi:hypothetical protein
LLHQCTPSEHTENYAIISNRLHRDFSISSALFASPLKLKGASPSVNNRVGSEEALVRQNPSGFGEFLCFVIPLLD